MKHVLFVASLAAASPAAAQNIAPPPGYAELAHLPVPVIAGDITDRPYRVIGLVNKGVRKATIFSKSASQEKVYRELWEDAKKLGADAVIKAEYGESRITGLSWGAREARGQAIKFLTDAEIAALPNGAAPVVASSSPAPVAAAPTPDAFASPSPQSTASE